MASSAKIPREEQRLAKEFGRRLAITVRHAGLSIGRVERTILGDRRYRRETGCVTRWLAGELVPAEVDVLALAQCCRVDPRWLATGCHSRASVIATKQLARLDAVSVPGLQILLDVLQLIEEPSLGRGTCRYCLCTFYEPCAGGCAWMDDEETICSACLTPEGGHG